MVSLKEKDKLYHRTVKEVKMCASNKEGGFYVARSKRIPQDANAVFVRPGQVHGTYKITKHLEVPIDIYRAVISQPVIERDIIAQSR